jgi:hypothetical protein
MNDELKRLKEINEELVKALEGFLHADPDVFEEELKAAKAAIDKASVK